tara:strand:- start:466 stop:972 length:507 start_codon:yes stop_codon:yes gene_type:complete
MLDAITVNNQGECSTVKVTKKKNGLYKNNKKLYNHYLNTEENLMIFSPYAVEEITNVPLLTFSFPPPLNEFIYPDEIYIVGGTLNHPTTLSPEVFVKHCADFKKTINKIEASLAVYDIPLKEVTCEAENDDDDSVIEEDYFNEEYEEDQEDEVEDEDWEDEDDEIVNT